MAGLDEQDIGRQLIVKADEVDQVGTAISSPSRQLPLSALRTIDGSGSVTASSAQTKDSARPATRPILRREGSAPPPPSQPPPPAPLSGFDSGNPTDSLSLPQLRQLVNQFPKVEQRAYAFQFVDAQSFEEEIEEWFQYDEQDRRLLLSSRDSFESRWKFFCNSQKHSSEHFNLAWGDDEPSWLEVDQPLRQQFLLLLSHELSSADVQVRVMFLESIVYILCGTWGLTAGSEGSDAQVSPKASEKKDHDGNRIVQIEWMHRGVDLLVNSPALQDLYACTSQAFDDDRVARDQSNEPAATEDSDNMEEKPRELWLLLTSWYLIFESARAREASDVNYTTPQALLNLEPNFLVAIVQVIARERWQDSSSLPLVRLLHLFWKTLLLMFGNTGKNLDEAKRLLQPGVDVSSAEASHPVLTASPLDYHLFRQEITSKYPAYNPPLPLIPLELEHKSMLPPVSNQPSRSHGSNGLMSGFGAPEANNSTSILHQPVHIATPAPSPPPSPVGPGGKAGKKQNYQTNQNFPFLYPPLDDTSNNIGGKGSTEMQDLMVGKKWEGSDIPASIIEAGQLFASRMRMTRAMRQLWRERELFLKHERGWNGTRFPNSSIKPDEDDGTAAPAVDGTAEEDEDNIGHGQEFRRLHAVEDFYHYAMPDLQSLVIVMMKAMVKNVQDIAIQNGSLQDGGQSGALPRSKSNANVNQTQNLPLPPPPPQVADLTPEDLDAIRLREISQKAISGALFILLKWLKLSHILKFEYFTQLLLDSNYIPIALKYFAHQNLEDMVAIKYDREDLGFFHLCHLNSDHPPLSPTSPQPASEPSSPDEAAPPPIQRHRRLPTSRSGSDIRQMASPEQMDGIDGDGNPAELASQQPHPSVDELGNPLAPLPSTPITDFSFRQFQTSIHLLRILQKITRAKAHRILLLVQYKSSQVLRRILRVPDPMLRLYVLKLFKSQVPYCGRKWRQSNMRVITAIYLHCRPELRDEWLAGMHDSNVEGDVDDSVPLEWALRGLTYWWQKRVYGDVMKIRGKNGELEGGQEIEEEERDFFQNELDNMGWGFANQAGGEDVAFGEEAPGVNGSGGEQWEQGGPLNMEGW